jgi:hypothetical protein
MFDAWYQAFDFWHLNSLYSLVRFLFRLALHWDNGGAVYTMNHNGARIYF